VRKNNYILTPGRYIDFKEAAEDGEAFDEKMRRLTADLKGQMSKASALDAQIKENLAKVGYEL
jgi:type I restriction enzyme M protein